MENALRLQPFSADHVLVTGANGYLGSLIVATLLRSTSAKISCLVRSSHDDVSLLEPIIEECAAQGLPWNDGLRSRIIRVSLPQDTSTLADMVPSLANVDEVIHCAGCLDYYDVAKLEAVNVRYTKDLLTLAKKLTIKRFLYISTAYSSGYQNKVTPESLLDEPASDPTEYTRTKREAERLVATSDLPFLVLRPSILIGTRDTGRYSGKRYGLYQQWMGLERLICDRYHAEFHTVAPKLPLNLIHQDAFCNAFSAAYEWLPDGAFMNIVSAETTSPSMRTLWDMWFEVTRPRQVFYYSKMDDVPLKSIPTRQRAYLTFAQINLEIASHHWQFETTWIERLRNHGMDFHDATIDTVRICQSRFVRSSAIIEKYMKNFGDQLAKDLSFNEVDEPSALASEVKTL
ncbi:MAG: SDR family oxidoreductase [Burkholderiales bacterium]|nr:SDR family oxidoreductase [Burkholderiales bacterium]